MFHKIPVGFSKRGIWLVGFPGFGILQPRPQGFSLSKLEGRFFKGKALGLEEVTKSVERDLKL